MSARTGRPIWTSTVRRSAGVVIADVGARYEVPDALHPGALWLLGLGLGLRGGLAGFRRVEDHVGDLSRTHVPQLLPGELLDLRVGVQSLDVRLELVVLGLERSQPLAGTRHVLVRLHDLAIGHHLGEEGDAEQEDEDRGHRHPGAPETLHRSLRNGAQPANLASWPRRSSILSSWLYLAVRSPRAGAPDLIWPAFVATARWEMNVSSVSPLRCETIRP